VYLLDEQPPSSLSLDASLKRVMLLRRDGATTDGAFVAEARARLGRDGVPICGGTSSHFSELNRRNPNPSGMDAIALALTPQMHAIDERSMVSSLEIQAQIVTRVREMTGDLPVVVSPVTLASHDGNGDDHGTPDERVGSAFGAAWTVGSVASLAAAGAASVTVHEAVDRTILTSEALSRAVRELTSRRGLPLDLVGSSDPRRVVAIAAAGTPILLANLTPDTQEAALGGTMVERRSLGPYELASLERSPR
jgi:D-apionolactonase